MRILILLLFVAMPQSLQAEDAAVSRRSKIQAEIAKLSHHPWAGKYCDHMQGLDTGPSFVWLSPKSGAAYLSEGWLTESDVGKISLADDSLIRIDWQHPHRSGQLPTERELLVVPYRSIVCLVPKTKIHAFCLAVRGDDNRLPLGLLRRKRSNLQADQANGDPQLPLEYRQYLDLPPIVTKVTLAKVQTRVKVDEDEEVVRQALTIDVGSADHVLPGMRFQLRSKESEGAFPTIEVRAVRENDADAQLRYFVEIDEEIPVVRVGQTFISAQW